MKKKIKLSATLLIFLFFNMRIYGQIIGSLDPTFGTGGTKVTELSVNLNQVAGMVIQPDQKIVICGNQNNYPAAYSTGILVRLNTDGSMDTSFGYNGIATGITDLQPYYHHHPLEIQQDGKLITVWGGWGGLRISRYNVNGTLDTTFGLLGNASPFYLNNWSTWSTIALQNDGKILAGGCGYLGVDDCWMIVARVNTDGSADSSFSHEGLIHFVDEGYDHSAVNNIAVQSDGRIVLMGYQVTGSYDLVLVGLKPHGNYDSTFGDDGITIFTVSDDNNAYGVGWAMALQSDDKLVVCGDFHQGATDDVFVVRFDKNGKPDSSFGTNGLTVSHISDQDDHANSVAVDSSGRILLAGWQLDASLDTIALLLRYNENGILDSTFGNNGVATLPAVSYLVEEMEIQADHKIVVAGTYASGTANGFEFAASRFLSNENVGIKDPLSIALSIGIFPNPATESITIKTDIIKDGMVNIRIADLTGRIFYAENYFNMEDHLQKTISLDKIIPGFYTLTIESIDFKSTGKLIVK